MLLAVINRRRKALTRIQAINGHSLLPMPKKNPLALCDQEIDDLKVVRSPYEKMRICLMCNGRFLSAGPANRRCQKCQTNLEEQGMTDFSRAELLGASLPFDPSIPGCTARSTNADID